MKCVTFQDRIDRFLAGTMGAAERNQSLAHLTGCEDCRRIVEIFGPERPAAVSDPALTAAILQKTSGAPCAGLQEQLGDLCDGRLSGIEQELAQAHLEACVECSRLHQVMLDIAAPLREMAHLPADEGLTRQILAATIGVEGRLARWRRTIGHRWEQWVSRPRFAWEVAYAATVVVALLTATPVSPWRELPGELRRWIQADSTRQGDGPLAAGPDLLVRLPGRVVDLGSSATYGIRVDLGERRAQASRAWTRLAEHGGQMANAVTEGDLARLGASLSQVGCDVKLLWKGVRKQLPPNHPLECAAEESSS